MSALWSACGRESSIRPIEGELFRIIESQEQVATTQLVDSLREQSVLEEMIERVKPPLKPGSEPLHYLLMTPFRYPPLRYGSRFGSRHEPSLFYGSLASGAALAECAYYRLLFWFGMETSPAKRIRTRHTMFQARYATERGVQLQHPPYDQHRAILVHPADYSATQALGSALREAGVEAFEFPSARDPDGGNNIAIFKPSGLASNRPSFQEEWWCDMSSDGVIFLNAATRYTRLFSSDMFLVQGRLPTPAL